MPLADRQAQVRTLVVGPGTDYRLLSDFNPFQMQVRADQSGGRPWGHGGWSGAEWAQVRTVPLRILPSGDDPGSWLTLHQQLVAAFAPVGDSAEDVELRFALGGTEYVLFGRPRMVEANSELIGVGKSFTSAEFVALDPLIYAGTESTTGAFGLPTFVGGLTVPFTVPFTIDAEAVDGEATAENVGTVDTGLTLRIDGPVEEPRVTVQGPDTVETIRFDGTVPSGRFLLIDTAGRTATIDGLPQASRRGQITGDWPLLPPGESTILFRAADLNDAGTLTVTWRSAWW